ncbi:hypothetical protein GCM10009557_39430 [Virgisporangium ochraceum]|uniref:AAA+ ATPase domain-containing protein n=1 Tax=Virgisporangium ochraceum TaxID=65505 RepID=A0A8J4A3X8_9ACTN|nr:hypothetical protein [Virgisporangium ochraceum]GIJ72321.1 hypothetical protein Voc01_072380 [Virgisporangium ochraceum]
MVRPLRYADAVALLGGDSPAVAALDRALGGALLAATGGGVEVVANLLGARTEAVRVGHELVGTLRDRIRGYSRFDRTERLMAAHTVVVITSFFEALNETPLPIDLRAVELTAEDQLRLARTGASERSMVRSLLNAPVPIPGPGMAFETVLECLETVYRQLAADWLAFVGGLAVWDRIDETNQRAVRTALIEAVPGDAKARYEIQYRQLALDAPEFALWAGQQEHQATRRSLAALESALRDLSVGRALDDRRAALARFHRAALTRSVLSERDAPDGVVIPTLLASYIDPDYRVVTDHAGCSPASESLWESAAVATDLATYLAGYLTSAVATEAPMVVLGQPGAGKSVLTRILAARLPAEQFLAVRVELREVPADADVQDQVEHAIRMATGHRISWPDLSGNAGDALPVILLDGFDELLQATGVSQTDYLQRVSRFQEREAIQGRPVAVVVTSRTAVADRARTPAASVLLRLEPFRPEQADEWLRIWNHANEDRWASGGLKALDQATVRRLPDLSAQPLMLLMLALYDADSNALQRQIESDLDEAGLYEQLLRTFAAREVGKGSDGRSDAAIGKMVDDELLRLSVVAFAMFNRGRQWVTEAELDADLKVLPGEPTRQGGLRADLGGGETALGRFFFIQRARAVREGRTLSTYEFLHATFGEYLVARLVHRLMTDLAALERASVGVAFDAGGCKDGLVHALLSFAPLATRGPVLTFLRELATRTRSGPDELAALPVLLFTRLESRTDDGKYAVYQPAPLSAWSRHGRYSLNLLLLATVYGGGVRAGVLFPDAADVVVSWRRYAHLWRAALTAEEWSTVLYAVRVCHRWVDGVRDLTIDLDTEPERPVDPIDLFWMYDVAAMPGGSDGPRGWRSDGTHDLARHVAFTGDAATGIAAQGLEPIFPYLAELALVMVSPAHRDWDRTGTPDPRPRTVLHDLLRLTVARATGTPLDDLSRTYLTLSKALNRWRGAFSAGTSRAARAMVLSHLRDHARELPTADLDEILALLVDGSTRGRDDELVVDAVVDHVAVVRPAADEWAELRQRVEGIVVGSTGRTYVLWLVGLLEAGVRMDAAAIELVSWDEIERQDPRLVARARAAFRLAFDRDLDEEVAVMRSLIGDSGRGRAASAPTRGEHPFEFEAFS